MAKQYDRRLWCFVRQRRPNAVQPLPNRNAGLVSLSIREDLNPCTATVCFLQTSAKLNFRVATVIFMYETADEANHQCWRDVVIPARGLGLIGRGACSLGLGVTR